MLVFIIIIIFPGKTTLQMRSRDEVFLGLVNLDSNLPNRNASSQEMCNQ